MRFISKLPVRKDFEESFMIRVIEGDRFLDIDNLYQYIDCGNMIEEYKICIILKLNTKYTNLKIML